MKWGLSGYTLSWTFYIYSLIFVELIQRTVWQCFCLILHIISEQLILEYVNFQFFSRCFKQQVTLFQIFGSLASQGKNEVSNQLHNKEQLLHYGFTELALCNFVSRRQCDIVWLQRGCGIMSHLSGGLFYSLIVNGIFYSFFLSEVEVQKIWTKCDLLLHLGSAITLFFIFITFW